jgi:hypothetical protein
MDILFFISLIFNGLKGDNIKEKKKNRIFFLMVDAIAKRFPIFHALGLFFFPSSILIRSSQYWIGIYIFFKYTLSNFLFLDLDSKP